MIIHAPISVCTGALLGGPAVGQHGRKHVLVVLPLFTYFAYPACRAV